MHFCMSLPATSNPLYNRRIQETIGTKLFYDMKKFIFGALMLFAVSANAQQTQQPAAQTSDKDYSEVADLMQTAGKLVQYGYASKQALPLIQAVQIYQQVGLRDEAEPAQKASEGQTVTGEQPAAKDNPVSTDIAKLIADARTFADGDKNLLAIIDGLGEVRGRVGGPARHVDRVLAGHTDVYTINFRGGEQAMVIVSGDGDTDLDLYVYDENGNLIDSDTDNTDQCVCTFTPRWTGPFTIRIKNLGRVYNQYTLVTN